MLQEKKIAKKIYVISSNHNPELLHLFFFYILLCPVINEFNLSLVHPKHTHRPPIKNYHHVRYNTSLLQDSPPLFCPPLPYIQYNYTSYCAYIQSYPLAVAKITVGIRRGNKQNAETDNLFVRFLHHIAKILHSGVSL